MSNFRDIWGGFIIMVACCIFGLIMALVGGIILDETFGHLDSLGWFDNADSDWTENGTWGNLFTTMNLYYFMCFLFPIVGIACFIKSIIASQGYDQYLES